MNLITLDQLLQSDPTIRNYFNAHMGRQPNQLAVELLIEAIRHRERNSLKQKHYHVAYVKHNRFLSPSQKQEITDKVTHIVPLAQQPTKIHAKPRPRNIQEPPLQVKSENEIETKEEIKSKEIMSSPKIEIADKQTQIDNPQQPEDQENRRQDSQKYLSPKQKTKITQVQKQKSPNTNIQKSYVSPTSAKQYLKEHLSPKVKEQSYAHHQTLNIQSNCKSFKESQLVSPKVGRENYNQVQSRIKFLIDRDKRSKRMEKMLEAQTHKIEKLEERQERLLLLQYEQERQMLRTTHLQDYIEKGLSDSESDSTEQNNPLSHISHKLDAINQRAESVRDYQHALFADLQRMRDKTYKINSQPVYPMSSSDEDTDNQPY